MMQDISELAALLRKSDLAAEQLLDQCLERIRRIDPEINSFVWLDEAGARADRKSVV